MNKVPISARLDPDDHRDLLLLRQVTDLTTSELISEAVHLYLKKPRRAKAFSRLEALEKSWQEISATLNRSGEG